MPKTPEIRPGEDSDDGGRDLVRLHRTFVKNLQKAVDEAPTASTTEEGRFVSRPTDELRERIEKATEEVRRELERKGRKQPEFRLTAEEISPEGDLTLRVTHPTTAVVSAEISPPPDVPTRVEFFSTRPRWDGGVETRLLGVAKHPDSDGRHTVRFESERFALRPDENMIIHGELVDERGFIIATDAIGIVE